MTASERGQPGTWRHLALWRGEDIDLAATRAALPCNDTDAARAMALFWPGFLHHVPGDRQWFAWDGRCHQPDKSGDTGRKVMVFADLLAAVLARCKQQLTAEAELAMAGASAADKAKAVKAAWDEWKQVAGYAAALRNARGASGAVAMLASVRGVPPEHMADRWPEHLNVANGILPLLGDPDLPEGQHVWPHNPAAMMTYCLDAPYDPAADCPEFKGLLFRACGENQAVYEHLIKVLGYCLLGSNPLQLVFFLSGPTASGKSALLEVVNRLLGPLAYEAKPALIGSARKERGTRHARHEATMRGKRLITIAETNDQIFIDENQLKSLTGQKRVAVELLYDKEMTFTAVSFTIVVANNDMPSVAHLDSALLRRLWVLPMGPTIDEAFRDKDKVDRILANEAAGVLALLVAGCRAAMANGGKALLMPPPEVAAKTLEYQQDQNTPARWLADRCIAANGSTAAVHGPDALNDYYAYCRGQQMIPLGRNHFYSALELLPGVWKSSGGSSDHVWFKGFVIKEPWS